MLKWICISTTSIAPAFEESTHMVANSQSAPACPTLGPNRADRIAASLRALASLVPFAGGALAEIVTEIVPQQRLDRIEQYLRQLAEEVARRNTRALEMPDASVITAERMKMPRNIDLIEDGAHLAARALSQDRLSYIVQCVANGIEAEDRAKIHHKRILSLIGQLDDEEILILEAYGSRNGAKFERLRPEPAHMNSPPSVIESNAIYDAAIAKLERLSLVEFRNKMKEVEVAAGIGKRTEKITVPDADPLGRPRGYRNITRLGRMVLRNIGLEQGNA